MNISPSVQKSRYHGRVCRWCPGWKCVTPEKLGDTGYGDTVFETYCLASQGLASRVAFDEKFVRPGVTEYLLVARRLADVLTGIQLKVWCRLVVGEAKNILGTIVDSCKQIMIVIRICRVDGNPNSP